jgi:hypothetical protein
MRILRDGLSLCLEVGCIEKRVRKKNLIVPKRYWVNPFALKLAVIQMAIPS